MQIKFKKTPEQVELIKAMAQKNAVASAQAQEAFAELVGPEVEKIILQADTTSAFFERFEFNEGSTPTLPVDPFLDYQDNTLSVWSQENMGGLPRNHVYRPQSEIPFTTWNLDSAISWEKKYNKMARLDVVGMYITMLVQEILLKIQNNAWATLLTAVAHASHKVNGVQKKHVFRATTAGVFDMDELNYWFTLVRRLNSSWAGGTPAGNNSAYGLTDLFCSPEFVQKIRKMSYNPVNTLGANNTTGTANSGTVALPESIRQKLFETAGIENFMGVNLNVLNEFGVGYAYNTLFAEAAGSNSYTNRSGGSGASFNGASEEVVVGINAGASFAKRPVEVSDPEENPETFVLQPDDQFTARSDNIGFYGKMSIGHLVTTTRPLTAFIL